MLFKVLGMASRTRTLWTRVNTNGRRERAQRREFYVEVWCKAANTIGAEVRKVNGGLLRIVRGGAATTVYLNYTNLDGPATLRAAGIKPFVNELLRGRGIPTPDCLAFTLEEFPAALGFLESHGECVVKPAAGTGAGAGVTTGVRTRSHLAKAAVAAAGHGPELLIEKHVVGRNVRLLYLDGRLLEAVERRPPSVVGDGRSTVGRLVRQGNRQRIEQGHRAAQVLLRRDLDMRRTLADQGLSWRSVPEAGRSIRLKNVINDNAAEDNVPVTDDVCDAIVEVGRLAAQALGVRLAGVDILTPDLSCDLSAAGGVVLEINTTPGLFFHKREDGCVPAAVPILEACLDQRRDTRVAVAVGDSTGTW